MAQGIEFRTYQESDRLILPDLFMRAIQSVYPNLQDGAWIDDLRDIPSNYRNGIFMVGIDNDEIAAMGGLQLSSTPGVAEMKRVAVEPKIHSKGLGRVLLAELEQQAVQLGVNTIELDTTEGQEAARHLYDTSGYRLLRIEDVNHPSGNVFPTYFYEKDI